MVSEKIQDTPTGWDLLLIGVPILAVIANPFAGATFYGGSWKKEVKSAFFGGGKKRADPNVLNNNYY